MTQSYIGTKQIVAWEQEKDGAPGYAVKYSDGYISWSPKAVFEAAYLPMGHVGHLAPHQQRVVGEKVQLDDKIAKLSGFFSSDQYVYISPSEKSRLFDQADAMVEYSKVLGARITAFNPSVESA